MIRSCIFFIVIALITLGLTAQSEDILHEIGTHAIPVKTIDQTDFSFLDQIAAEHRIIGYGEANHGTADFTELAEAMILYLNEKHAYRHFVIEAGVGEVAYLEDWLRSNWPVDSLTSILQQRISTWRYRTTEFIDLMVSLRTYNLAHPAKSIQLYGCEMQWVKPEYDRLYAYLHKFGLAGDLPPESFNQHLWQHIDLDLLAEYSALYWRLRKLLLAQKELLTAKGGETAYQDADRNLRVIGQFITTLGVEGEQHKHDLRDQYMFENVRWIELALKGEEKIFVWTHNAHVMDGFGNGGYVNTLGHHLRRMYREKYYALGTDYGPGKYVALNPETYARDINEAPKPAANQITYYLMQLGIPNAFLDFKSLRQNLPELYRLNLPVTANVGAIAISNPKAKDQATGRIFDGLIYLANTQPIQMVE
ncbi:hypothetical protein CEQ90_15495 [Lewinellaceae bacterium SD302]|nr:hypothetical protein CEQ90_15495 [Lewinellaceae bacterium SD302]